MFTPEDRAAIVDVIAPLLERTQTAAVQHAILGATAPTWRPGTCLGVDPATSTAWVVADGDTTEIAATIIGNLPAAGERVMVVFVPPAAVFVFAFAGQSTNVSWGHVGSASVTTSQTGVTTEADLTGLAVTFLAAANRRYRVSFEGQVYSSVAGDNSTVRIKEGATTLAEKNVWHGAVNTQVTANMTLLTVSPSAGLHTYKMTLTRATGTGSHSLLASATAVAALVVEDIGPT